MVKIISIIVLNLLVVKYGWLLQVEAGKEKHCQTFFCDGNSDVIQSTK